MNKTQVVKRKHKVDPKQVVKRKHKVDPKQVQDEISEIFRKLQYEKAYRDIEIEIEEIIKIVFPVEMLNNITIEAAVRTGLASGYEEQNIFFVLNKKSGIFRFEFQEEDFEIQLNVREYSLSELYNALDIINGFIIEILDSFKSEIDLTK